MRLDSLQDVLHEQLTDLYDAEKQLVDALPKVAQASANDSLREAIEEHLEQTRGHVERLDEVFELIGWKPGDEQCEAMKGLIAEGEEVLEAQGEPNSKDAAIIAAAQRVEHYEMAGYGSARAVADELGLKDAAKKLDDTLAEEKEADEL